MAALNSVFWHAIPDLIPELVSIIAFNVVRITLTLWAGWIVTARGIGGYWKAAFAGGAVFFIDHPVVTGTYFLFIEEVEAFQGVFLSFAMFFWISMLIGLVGGIIGSKQNSKLAS